MSALNRLALFDCDGTLIDSQHNITAAMDMAFAACGLDPPGQHKVRGIVGLSVPEAIATLAPDQDDATQARLDAAFRSAYHDLTKADDHHCGHLFDGILTLLDTLEARGWLLGIATGNSDRGLKRILDFHGLGGRFVTLQTASRHPSKPHPSMALEALGDAGADPARSIMIGDTSFDIDMGHAAGMTSIGVVWGYHDEAELHAAAPDYIARNPADIAQIAETLK